MLRNDVRNVVVAGAHNIRDMGGLPTVDSRVTRSRILFRSDSLHTLEPEGVTFVAEELGVRRLIDLRSPEEADREPPEALMARGVEVVRLPIARNPSQGIVTGTDESELVGRYLEYFEEHGSKFVHALRLMAEAPEVPTMFHCRLGKDRTGVLASLLLSLLAVPSEHIVADYVATNENMGPILDALRVSPIYGENVRNMPPAMYAADQSTMHGFLNHLAGTFGTIDVWADSVGLNSDDRGRLRENLTVPA
ncbi:tyrosine-protein phosphatase [Rhodococcus koreensis]|uniref:tyrosine-protein phosphatase n=1 Tax=Rhodococcus koreensis TaxID=99653 RepID=UPI0036708C2A